MILTGKTCTTTTTTGNIISIIFGFVLSVLMAGFVGYLLKLIRKQPYDIKDTFRFFKENFVLCILVEFLSGLFIGLWSLLLVIPGIVAILGYSMIFPLLADNKSDEAMGILRKSKEMMYGHKSDYFIFNLSFIGWYLLIPLTLGILSIYVIPYVSTAQLLYYEELSKQKTA